MSRSEKKNKFTENRKSKSGTYFLLGILVVGIIAAGAYGLLRKSSADADAVNIGAVDYTGQALEFGKVQATDSGGDVTVSLSDIKNKKTTTFDVQGINFTLNNGTPFNYVPLLAFVSPKGNLTVATSLCEPCSGTTFHVEGDQLVCNSCGTRWSLDGLQGISGGCTKYPPETIKYTVQGDKLIIKKADLQNWKPRAL
ncbi:MAG: Fe-S-containing protein [Eubacteriales bacterium]